MENLRDRVISAGIGASSSMAGILSLSKCVGGSCTSCFGCAGAGAGILLLILFNRMKPCQKEEKNGMA